MIVFDLQCRDDCGTFEAWFQSNADYEEQRHAGLVQCPVCQSSDIGKAPMAPSVPRKAVEQTLTKLSALQADALRNSRWVGEEFAETARAMHYGEMEHEQVHGKATIEEARSLIDDGIPVAPLPLPIAPPNEVN